MTDHARSTLTLLAGLSAFAVASACGHRDGSTDRGAASTTVPAGDLGERTPDAAAAPSVATPRARPSLVVGYAPKAIHPTGHFDVTVWGGAVNTHTLLQADGTGAVPVNEGRFLWGQGQLYLFFYAGDLDIEGHATKHDGTVWKDDSVTWAFFPPSDGGGTKYVIQITPTGVLADGTCPRDAVDLGDSRCDLRWESGARFGTDSDGTLNHIHDFDEEWAVEVALPLRSLGFDADAPPPRILATVRRCEISYDGPHACGLWGTPEHPGELVLADR